MPKRLCTTVHFLLPFALPTRPRLPDGGVADADAPPHGPPMGQGALDDPAFASGEITDPAGFRVPGSVADAAAHAPRTAADAAAGLARAERSLQALLDARQTPALDAMIGRARRVDGDIGDDYQRSLPDARWLTQQYGLPVPGADQDTPLAPFMMLADGVDPGSLAPSTDDDAAHSIEWACLEPAHIEVTHDRLVLAHPQTLAIDDAAAAQLADEMAASAAARGLYFVAPTATRWYLGDRADTLLTGLHGASPLRAAGRSIDIWLPVDGKRTDAQGLAQRSSKWIGFQTEVQMAWHAHPVNAARTKLGQRPVNAVWLHGRGAWPAVHAANTGSAPASSVKHASVSAPGRVAPMGVRAPFSATFADGLAARGLSIAAGYPAAALPTDFAAMGEALRAIASAAHGSTHSPANHNAATGRGTDTNDQRDRDAKRTTSPQTVLIHADALSLPMIDEDWGRWLDAFATLEKQWFAPALQALRDHAIDEIRLTLCGEHAAHTLALRRTDLLAFWRRRTFRTLLS